MSSSFVAIPETYTGSNTEKIPVEPISEAAGLPKGSHSEQIFCFVFNHGIDHGVGSGRLPDNNQEFQRNAGGRGDDRPVGIYGVLSAKF